MELNYTLKENLPKIFPVKFGEIPPSSLGGDVVESKLLTDGRWTDDDRHQRFTNAQLEPN